MLASISCYFDLVSGDSRNWDVLVLSSSIGYDDVLVVPESEKNLDEFGGAMCLICTACKIANVRDVRALFDFCGVLT